MEGRLLTSSPRDKLLLLQVIIPIFGAACMYTLWDYALQTFTYPANVIYMGFLKHLY